MTDAIFVGAKLGNTDFRGAKLNKVKWTDGNAVVQLNTARFENTILAELVVRELIINKGISIPLHSRDF